MELKKPEVLEILSVDQSISSTTFELQIKNKDFTKATMHDLLVFVQSQLGKIQGAEVQDM